MFFFRPTFAAVGKTKSAISVFLSMMNEYGKVLAVILVLIHFRRYRCIQNVVLNDFRLKCRETGLDYEFFIEGKTKKEFTKNGAVKNIAAMSHFSC